MNHVTAVLLDLTNIVGGFLLATALLSDLPRVGPVIDRAATATGRASVVIGVLALVMGGYYLLLHLTTGPHVFHFELVGIGIGVATLRDRLFPRTGGGHPHGRTSSGTPGTSGSPGGTSGSPGGTPGTPGGTPGTPGGTPGWIPGTAPAAPTSPPGATATAADPVTGGALLLAVFGLIAIVVGIQGLFTPDG